MDYKISECRCICNAEITSGNLNAPTLMIGERASDFILNS